jgi:hypothetical protein
MAAEQESSIYEPLPEGDFFRVLKLHPGNLDEEIHCSLEVSNFESSKGTYDASQLYELQMHNALT